MRLASHGGVNFRDTQRLRILRVRKTVYQLLRYRAGCPKTVGLIVGCQRSGTSLLSHIFRLDLDCRTYDEKSVLSSRDTEDNGFRLDPVPEVRERLRADRAPLVVLKPLVESQRTRALLDDLPGSRAIWCYRDYRAVAASNVAYFRRHLNAVRDLEPIVAGDPRNWRSERLSVETREQVRSLFSPDMDLHAAAALFWWVRNRLYFEQDLGADERVTLCRYEDLVSQPADAMRSIYRFLGRPYPGDRIVGDVVTTSRRRGREIELPAPIQRLCDDTLAELDAVNAAEIVASGRDRVRSE
ncbi:MAG: sulfotransferase [Candidatus Krumholzibacteriia bacterium]